MTNTDKKILINIRIKESVWKRFKKITQENHSDSSKQIRYMIDQYLKDHEKNVKN